MLKVIKKSQNHKLIQLALLLLARRQQINGFCTPFRITIQNILDLTTIKTKKELYSLLDEFKKMKWELVIPMDGKRFYVKARIIKKYIIQKDKLIIEHSSTEILEAIIKRLTQYMKKEIWDTNPKNKPNDKDEREFWKSDYIKKDKKRSKAKSIKILYEVS